MDDILLPEEIFKNLETATVSISEKKISPKKASDLMERLAVNKDEHVLPTYGKVSKVISSAEKVRYNAIGAELFGNGQVVKKIQTEENAKWWETRGAEFANFMTELRQKFLNLKKMLDTSFLWDVFKRAALITLLLFLRAQNWKITWERLKKIPMKIYDFFKRHLTGPESIAKKYETVGNLITNVKDTWQDLYALIQSTDWKKVKKSISIGGISKMLDRTATVISNKIYDLVKNLNPANWLTENSAEEDRKMQAELLSNGNRYEMEQNMRNETITAMDELVYKRHGVALFQNKTLTEMLDEVGDIETETIKRGGKTKEEQIVSIGDTIIDYSDASGLQQNIRKARKAITSKAQEGIESLRGLSSKAALEEIILALEGKSKLLSAEEQEKLEDILGDSGRGALQINALKELQSMAQKTITYTEQQPDTEENETEEQQEEGEEKTIQQIIKEQSETIQKSLDEAEDVVSRVNGAVLATFKSEKTVKDFIEKRDKVFPSLFIEDTKDFINENFKAPSGGRVQEEKVKEEEQFGNESSLTVVSVIETKRHSTALDDIVTTVLEERQFISRHIETLQEITDKMRDDRKKHATATTS